MKTPYQRFWLLLKPDQKEIYQVYTYAFFKGVIALSLPLGIQSIINLIQAGRVSTAWMVLVGIVILGIALGGYMQLMQMRIMEIIQQKIFARAAFDFTFRIPKIKFEEINKHFAPELVNRFFDIITLQKSLSKIVIDFSSAILQIVFGLILLSVYHSFFIFFSLFLLLLVFLIFRLTFQKGMESSLKESSYKFKLVSWLEELARSKDSFKLAGITQLPEMKTDERVFGYLTSREKHYQVLRKQYVFLLMFKVFVALGLLLIGGLLVLKQQMNIGQFVAAEIIILLVIDSSEKLILSLENVFDSFTSLEKLGQVVDLELDVQKDASSLTDIGNRPFTVEISQVSFKYPTSTTNVLNNINYHFKENHHYCITGSNGSGKSTLLHLIAGLYKPQSGSICINGFPIENYSLPMLYSHLGNGLNEETIFEGTLYENITLGRSFITLDMVQQAIQHIFLSDYIKSLPKGLDHGIEVSGGKLPKSIVQRIILARSIVNNPKLLLVENQLDLIEEDIRKKIIDFLTDKKNAWTLICISNDQYLQSTVDHVIIMREGGLQI